MEVGRLFVRHSELYLTNCRQPVLRKTWIFTQLLCASSDAKMRKREMKWERYRNKVKKLKRERDNWELREDEEEVEKGWSERLIRVPPVVTQMSAGTMRSQSGWDDDPRLRRSRMRCDWRCGCGGGWDCCCGCGSGCCECPNWGLGWLWMMVCCFRGRPWPRGAVLMGSSVSGLWGAGAAGALMTFLSIESKWEERVCLPGSIFMAGSRVLMNAAS